MPAVHAGTAVVCTGTTVIQGPIQVDGILNQATTSSSITKGANTIWSGVAATNTVSPCRFRSSGPITVTVVGGGSITLYLKNDSNR